MTDRAAYGGSRNAVVARYVPGNASDCRARYASLGVGGRRHCSESECDDKADSFDLHAGSLVDDDSRRERLGAWPRDRWIVTASVRSEQGPFARLRVSDCLRQPIAHSIRVACTVNRSATCQETVSDSISVVFLRECAAPRIAAAAEHIACVLRMLQGSEWL
jgi:hypothetical protein